MKIRIASLVCCMLLFAATANAGTLTYERANQLYHNQQYTEALELYNQMINEGMVNASVYYNAGNTYFKLKKMGWAVWCYEKALQLQPSNSCIKENLLLTRKKIASPFNSTSNNPISWFKYIVNLHSQNNWALGALLFFTLAMLFVILKKRLKLHPFFIAIRKLFWLLFIIYLIGTISNYVFHKICKFGIILENTILYNNPKEKGLQKPTATEGTKVQILQTVKGSILNVGKYKVQLPSGKVAWVEQQCMGTLATN